MSSCLDEQGTCLSSASPRRRRALTQATENLSDQDKFLDLLNSDKVFFGETFLYNEKGQPLRYWPHQIKDLLDPSPVKLFKCGRKVGKSIDLLSHLFHIVFQGGRAETLVCTPQDSSLSTLIKYFEMQKTMTPRIRNAVKSTTRKPYYTVEFNNGAVVHFRQAGPRGDAFRSLHVDNVLVDEGAYFTEKAWSALLRCRNLDGSSLLYIYSTPNGRRDSTYYLMCESGNYPVYHWPSWLNPGWNDAQKKFYIDVYKGENTADYQHEIAGEHGEAAYGVFDMKLFSRCLVPVPDYDIVNIAGPDLGEDPSIPDATIRERLEELLGLLHKYDAPCHIGADLGYTSDPSEIIIAHDFDGVLVPTSRIHTERVNYSYLLILFSIIFEWFSPLSAGIDLGNNGLAVTQLLRSSDEYRYLKVEEYLYGINFGSKIELEVPEVDPNNPSSTKIESLPMKGFITDLIIWGQQSSSFAWPGRVVDNREDGEKIICQDALLEQQIANQTYSVGQSGNIIYSKGNDHVPDGLRCLLGGKFLWENAGVDVPAIPVLTTTIKAIEGAGPDLSRNEYIKAHKQRSTMIQGGY